MQQLATLFSRTNVCNLLPVCIGLRDYDVWKLTCCSLSSQLFSSQKLSWEGVLREGSRPFFNRHGATVYMQKVPKVFFTQPWEKWSDNINSKHKKDKFCGLACFFNLHTYLSLLHQRFGTQEYFCPKVEIMGQLK